ncbi:MAG: hypothetical protein IMF12_00220, partial [Proteobacteria bacterium]|nr:hypothetical protein [Pseudomonadota bacterium]
LEITQVKPSQLAKKMGVKSNSVYRWLAGNPIRQGEEYREKLFNCIKLLGFHADKNGIKLFNEFLQAAGQSILSDEEQFFPNPSQSSQLPANISDLPNPTTPLVGRTKELKILNETLYNREINVVGIIAAGGIGKSALTHEWLEQLETRNYGNIQYVFVWSFYNQANSETQTSSTLFFEKALPYFGYQGD